MAVKSEKTTIIGDILCYRHALPGLPFRTR